MKIVWATPFNQQSAIGAFSHEVCKELARQNNDIIVKRIEVGAEAELPSIASNLTVLSSSDSLPNDFDLLVINYGNHSPFHGRVLELASEHVALAIFHDAEMRDFAWGLATYQKQAIPQLVNISDSSCTKSNSLVHPDSATILEAIAAMSAAAIVHAKHYFDQISLSCPGPTSVIPLCFPDKGAPDPEPITAQPYRLTVFGVINKYKQVDRIIRVVYELKKEIKEVFEVHLAGAIEESYKSEVIRLSKNLGLREPIFYGYLSDEELSSVLVKSDITFCLRYPVTEGGSASVITALYHGQPLVVSNIASYSEIPDGLVAKVEYGEETSTLKSAICGILNEPKLAKQRALEARGWARNQYAADSYVQNLLPIIAKAVELRPKLEACRSLAKNMIDSQGFVMLSGVEEVAMTAQFVLFDDF